MQDKEKELSKYRLSLANETLANAKMCLDNQFFRDCINRSYYVAFYAIKAVLAVEGVDFKMQLLILIKNMWQQIFFRKNWGKGWEG